MGNLILGSLILISVITAIFLILKGDFTAEGKKNPKKLVLGALAIAILGSVGIVGTAEKSPQSNNIKKTADDAKLKDELLKKEEQLALAIDKIKKSQAEANQAKAETELHTTNILKLQEDLLRRNDEFNLLKEELDLRYKVDASKILRENEDKIRKSATAEAQRLLEKSQLEARIKVAKSDIETKIVSKWTPPKDQHNLTIVAQYVLDDKGGLVSVDLIQKSGSQEADKSVMEAIRNAAPFTLSEEQEVRKGTLKNVSKFVLP